MATRVLIVAGDAGTRNQICDILRIEGYQTDTGITAAEAVERIDEASYDLLIIDWHLPDMTVGELLPQLRSHAPDASILIVTGSSDIQHAIHAMRLGASDYIIKPVLPELLLGSVRRARNLQTAQKRVVQSERLAAIGTAVAAVAHESRNALQRIRARVDLIRLMHENDKELLKDLEAIESAALQLQSQFEELREFSAPIVLSKSCCGLQNLIQNVWQHVQFSAAQPGSRLSVPEHDTRCMIDPTRIKQVLRNLFENAIEASGREARVEVDWTIREIDEDQTLLITVRDHGPGFTEEQQSSAFAPFFTTKGHGTGLGLPICRRIVEAHGGSIVVEDSVDSGGAITIALPGVIRNETRQEASTNATKLVHSLG
jgi:signal transduction histidine kinase